MSFSLVTHQFEVLADIIAHSKMFGDPLNLLTRWFPYTYMSNLPNLLIPFNDRKAIW